MIIDNSLVDNITQKVNIQIYGDHINKVYGFYIDGIYVIEKQTEPLQKVSIVPEGRAEGCPKFMEDIVNTIHEFGGKETSMEIASEVLYQLTSGLIADKKREIEKIFEKYIK